MGVLWVLSVVGMGCCGDVELYGCGCCGDGVLCG